MTNKIKVGITVGDINGIGPEVIVKTFSDDRIYRQFTPIFYGISKALSHYKNQLNADSFKYTLIKSFDRLSPKSLNVINVSESKVEIKAGESSGEAGEIALMSIDAAIKDFKENNLDVLVTAPLNKSNIPSKNGETFTGQTEYIAKSLGAKDQLMLLFNESLKVGLATTHVPVREITQNLTEEQLYSKIKLFEKSLKMDFLIDKPRIAVLGLNPHAGDSGLIGDEEENIINPAIKNAKKNGMTIMGPLSADGFFGSGKMGKFDGVLAMYHDQGLIPLKLIGFGSGVNFTAGLSLVRTSPDHGTAYDIAGKNIADASSFRMAMFEGLDIFKRRQEYQQMRSNPLQKTAIQDE